MAHVKVTGYMELDDISEFDSGPMGPLSAKAVEKYRGMTGEVIPSISDLEDLEFAPDPSPHPASFPWGPEAPPPPLHEEPPMPTVISMTKIKNALKRHHPDLVPELRNVRINGSLQGCSGFVTDPATERVAYLSTDVNHGTNSEALYRVAADTRDFVGGRNRRCPLDADEIVDSVASLLSTP